MAEIWRVARPGGAVKIMVYGIRAPYAWYMYLRHALLKGHITKGRRWAIYNYHGESFGTKAYTPAELTQMMRLHPHKDPHFHFWEKKVPANEPFAAIRTLMHRVLPSWMGWYLGFEFTKIGGSG